MTKSAKIDPDFRARRDRAYQERSQDGVIDAAATLDLAMAEPVHGDRWGNWEYNAETFVLWNEKTSYEVDLERCSTSAEMLDWIFQVAGKAWATADELGHLVEALDDTLHPQGTLCGFGKGKTLDVKAFLTEKAAKPAEKA